MITMIQALPVGNALRLFVEPPDGSTNWVILRKATNSFSGHDDAGAFVVAEGAMHTVIDFEGLQNGSTYWYCDYAEKNGVWTAGAPVSGSPASTYQDASTDVHTVVLERLQATLNADIKRGLFATESGKIKVLSAPPLFSEVKWPLVTVHATSDSSGERGIGEVFEADVKADGGWIEHTGWLANVSVSIIGWTINADQRKQLRKAIRRALIANLDVFDAAGMVEVSISLEDVDDTESYECPVYQTICTLTCMAPEVITDSTAPVVTEVDVSVDAP